MRPPDNQRAPSEPDALAPASARMRRGPWGIAFFVAIASLVIGLAVWLTLGGSTPIPAPLRQVIAFEAAVAAGELDAAHAFVDYAYQLNEVLDEFWASGDEADREALLEQTREMLADTTQRLWPECCEGRDMIRSLRRSSEDAVVWVESRPVGEGAPDFAWLYRLHRREKGWAITQREYLKDQTPSDSTRFWPMARKAVAKRLGREPTLKEFQANLRSVMPQLAIRSYRVPSKEVLEERRQEQLRQAPSPEDVTDP